MSENDTYSEFDSSDAIKLIQSLRDKIRRLNSEHNLTASTKYSWQQLSEIEKQINSRKLQSGEAYIQVIKISEDLSDIESFNTNPVDLLAPIKKFFKGRKNT